MHFVHNDLHLSIKTLTIRQRRLSIDTDPSYGVLFMNGTGTNTTFYYIYTQHSF